MWWGATVGPKGVVGFFILWCRDSGSFQRALIVGGILGSSEVVLWVVGLAGWLVFRGQEMCRWSGFRPEASASRLRLYDVVFSPAQIHRLTAVTATTKWENASWIKANRLKCWGVIIQAQMEPSTWPDDHRPFFLNTVVHICVQVCVHLCFQLFKLRDEQVVFLH